MSQQQLLLFMAGSGQNIPIPSPLHRVSHDATLGLVGVGAGAAVGAVAGAAVGAVEVAGPPQAPMVNAAPPNTSAL